MKNFKLFHFLLEFVRVLGISSDNQDSRWRTCMSLSGKVEPCFQLVHSVRWTTEDFKLAPQQQGQPITSLQSDTLSHLEQNFTNEKCPFYCRMFTFNIHLKVIEWASTLWSTCTPSDTTPEIISKPSSARERLLSVSGWCVHGDTAFCVGSNELRCDFRAVQCKLHAWPEIKLCRISLDAVRSQIPASWMRDGASRLPSVGRIKQIC